MSILEIKKKSITEILQKNSEALANDLDKVDGHVLRKQIFQLKINLMDHPRAPKIS